MASSPTAELSSLGVSIWLDDLSRERIQSGSLAQLIETRNVVGVTTNPTIFASALSNGASYAAQVAELAAAGVSVAEAIETITTDDVRAACDIFAPVAAASNGQDGRVSIEVEPGLAHDSEQTIAQAKRLWARVDRKNAMIKIPATAAGIPAIAAVLAEGISVNVTLIFSLDRYREVIVAYLDGISRARAAGHDISTIHSVASFFVSRVDTEIDARLSAVGTPEALALKSQAALANARLAYQVFEEEFAKPRAQELLAAGANVQRPLWASTGVKDPALPDTLYVTELAVAQTVNTMPEKTLEATFDHGSIVGDRVHGTYVESRATIDALESLGVHYREVTEKLEAEGVEKFIISWTELTDTVRAALEAAR